MLETRHLVKPYSVGKDGKSTSVILPHELVKSMKINPKTTFLLLKTTGIDEIQLRILREENLFVENNSINKTVDSDSFAAKDQHVGIAKGKHWK